MKKGGFFLIRSPSCDTDHRQGSGNRSNPYRRPSTHQTVVGSLHQRGGVGEMRPSKPQRIRQPALDRSYRKEVFGPPVGVGRSFHVLEIPAYPCG